MPKDSSKRQGLVRLKNIEKFKRMSAETHMELAKHVELDWKTFDALVQTAKPKVLRFLADRSDLSALWRYKALHALRLNKVEIPINEWIHSLDQAINDENISTAEKQALQAEKQQSIFVEFSNKLEKISSIRANSDPARLERICFIVQNYDESFNSLFKFKISNKILNHYVQIIDYLYTSKEVAKVITSNSLLLSECYAISLNRWKLPQDNILNWHSEIFASFLYIILVCKFDRVETLRLFESMKDMVELLNKGEERLFEDATALAENRRKETKRTEEIREQERLKKLEDEQTNSEAARKKQAEFEHRRRIRKECDWWKDKVAQRFPWPVPFGEVSFEVEEKLRKSGMIIENGRLSRYKPLPIKIENSNTTIDESFVTAEGKQDLTFGKRSLLESFTREFPKDKEFLVEAYRDFTRFLDHRKRYLCKNVCLEIVSTNHKIAIRLDQVALRNSDGQFKACWVISVFGLSAFVSQGIKMMRAQALGKADFMQSLIKDNDLKAKFNSVYYVKKVSSEGARSWIGLLIELLEFTYCLEATRAEVVIDSWEINVLKHREIVFESALKRTSWQGSRSSGDGTNFCEICGHEIWDAPSVARRIGPDCWEKVRFTERGRAVLSSSLYSREYDEKTDRLAVPFEDWVQSMAANLEKFSLK